LTLLPVAPAAAAPAGFTLLHILVIVCSELLVGFVLGLTASLLFAGFQMAGQIMGFQLGFSIVNIIDPQTSVQVSVLSILSNFLGLMFFLLIDGHHWLVQAVSGSLDYLPVGGARLTGPVVEMVMRLSSQIFVSGLQIAAPVVAATITADVLMGIIGRVAPQVNILIVGMPVKTLVGLGTMSVTFYFLPTLFGRYFLELSGVLMGLVQRLG
ncbi:MAG: flagellar biosynthetic protein FliR, partial [Acidobacteriota bacterium]